MLDALCRALAAHKEKTVIFLAFLAVANALVFAAVGAEGSGGNLLTLHFLDVGQGDATLAVLPTGVKVLIDGGPPNGRVLTELARVLPPTDRYLDLVIMSHPQVDHFGGLLEVVRRFRVGAFLMPGREGEAASFQELMSALEEGGVRTVALGAGDRVTNGENRLAILSPTSALLAGKAVNDAGIVAFLTSKGARVLFTGDLGAKASEEIARRSSLAAHVLKVPHHGSKFSSSAAFLRAVRPKVAVIEVGKNSYGHPAPETLARLEAAGARVYRTDQDGNVRVVADGASLKVFQGF